MEMIVLFIILLMGVLSGYFVVRTLKNRSVSFKKIVDLAGVIVLTAILLLIVILLGIYDAILIDILFLYLSSSGITIIVYNGCIEYNAYIINNDEQDE